MRHPMSSSGRYVGAAAAALLVCGTLVAHPAAAAPPPPWTRTWGTALTTAAPADESGVTGRQTLRMVVHTSVGGGTARIQLSNTFSQEPVTIGHATLARQSSGSSATDRPVTLTFGGSREVVLAPGQSVYSDAASFPVRADEDLLVSVHLPNPVKAAPYHPDAWTTSYISAPGDTTDHTDEPTGANFRSEYTHWAFLSGLDVTADSGVGTVVAIGDSQTDVAATTRSSNRRWTDAYARALRAQGRPMGVANAGISANRVLSRGARPAYGESALERFDRDVLAVPNVKSVVFYEGINDITNGAKATDLIAGIRRLADRSRAAGLPFTAATIPPFKGNWNFTAEKEAERQQVNAYLRTTRDIDAYVDFDAATRDPLDPARLFTAYRADEDKLHFTDNGAQVLADTLAGPVPPVPFTPNFSQMAAADFTGDGMADFIARDRNANLYMWKGLGDGTFTRPDLAHPMTDDWHFTETKAADFTGDGKADLIAKGTDGDLYLWAGRGNGTFEPRRVIRTSWDYTQTTAADFTGDGVADLIARDAKGNLYRWTGQKGGTLSEPTRLSGDWNYTQTTAGDFTADGKPDLIAKDPAGNLHLWKGDGDGTFTRPDLSKPLTGGWHYSETTAGTFYGGGTSHLLARDEESGVLREWVNRGNADFSRPLRLTDGW
ncbi:FG-GAP-like repeat-containing protein [Streptomyces abikoensis]|uniref:FG-GAP-like repeat-containing protein n=1 Tax=Streptomyces abikoensis TaxID=97398 RepID=UPI0036AED647